jgi:hypothetical protein
MLLQIKRYLVDLQQLCFKTERDKRRNGMYCERLKQERKREISQQNRECNRRGEKELACI